MQTTLFVIINNDGFEARFVYRKNAVAEVLDLACVDVHARDGVAHFGETRARHQADVACADNC